MKTTEKRINLALTKEDLRELDFLTDHFGENQCAVIKRGLILLNFLIKNEVENKRIKK